MSQKTLTLAGTNSTGVRNRNSKPTTADPRQRAKDLNAADARIVLLARLPAALKALGPGQVQHIQRVMDAAVVDPEITREAMALYKKAQRQYGSLSYPDQELLRKSHKVMSGHSGTTEADRRIKLNIDKLLTHDALAPITDNPDEATYLRKVRATLNDRGAWLRFGPKFVRDPQHTSSFIVDPRSFEVWLSLGPDGGAIPTKSGMIDREALMGTQLLGAGYYEAVSRGNVRKTLEREMRRLRSAIDLGRDEHQYQAKVRREALAGVPEASDKLGGATFPNQAMWDEAHQTAVRVENLIAAGKISAAADLLAAATIYTQIAAMVLEQYVNATVHGAGRAAKIAAVVTTVVAIIDVITLASAAKRLATRILIGEGSGGVVNIASKGGKPAPPAIDVPAARAPTNYAGREAGERTVHGAVTLQTGERGIMRARDLAEEARAAAWLREAHKELYAATNNGTRTISIDEVSQILDRIRSKWGTLID